MEGPMEAFGVPDPYEIRPENLQSQLHAIHAQLSSDISAFRGMNAIEQLGEGNRCGKS